VLAPILQTSANYFPWHDNYTKSEIEISWWITLFALISFEFGYVLIQKKGVVSVESSKVLSKKGVKALFLGAVFSMLVGIANVGFSSLFIPRNELAVILSTSVGGDTSKVMIMSAIMRVPAVIILILFANDLLVKIKSGSYTRDDLAQQKTITFLLFVIVVIVNNPVSTARFWVGCIFLSLYLVWLINKTEKRSGYWFGINVLILLLAFPVMDVFRKSLDGDIVRAFQNSDPGKELVKSPDFDAFQQQINTAIAVELEGINYGRQVMSTLLFFVPRGVWEGKSEPTGVLVASTLGYKFKNLSAPISAEFYMDGKLPGVIIGMLLLGLLYRMLYLQSGLNSSLSTSFFCFFCAYQTYFLRGSMMAVVGFVFASIFLILIIKRYQSTLYEDVKG